MYYSIKLVLACCLVLAAVESCIAAVEGSSAAVEGSSLIVEDSAASVQGSDTAVGDSTSAVEGSTNVAVDSNTSPIEDSPSAVDGSATAVEGSTEGSLSASLPLDVREYEGTQPSGEKEPLSYEDGPPNKGLETAYRNWESTTDSKIPLREILLRLKPPSLVDDEEDEHKKSSMNSSATNTSDPMTPGDVIRASLALTLGSDGEKNNTKSKNKKAICSPTVDATEIQLLNSTGLQQLFSANPNFSVRSTEFPCSLVFFFSRRCKFSVAASPYINLINRHLKGVVSIYAVDTRAQHSTNAHFGVIGTPALSLFHGTHHVTFYNATSFTVPNLKQFIEHFTDVSFPANISLAAEDYESDILPLTVDPSSSLPLLAAWLFLLSVAFHAFVRSNLFEAISQAVLASWREAEAHQHND